MIAAAMIWDWRINGRSHRVYRVGAVVIVLVQALRIPFSVTTAWFGITEILRRLVQ